MFSLDCSKSLSVSPNSKFSSVQLLSHVRLFVTPWTAAHQASLSITNSWSPPKPMSPPSIFPSIRVFSNESVLCRWPKYWSFSFNISPSSEHPGLISFRMDWLELLAVQGTLTSLLQYHSSKASILLRSGFFIIQLSQILSYSEFSHQFSLLRGFIISLEKLDLPVLVTSDREALKVNNFPGHIHTLRLQFHFKRKWRNAKIEFKVKYLNQTC